jgi:hypothetical protein
MEKPPAGYGIIGSWRAQTQPPPAEVLMGEVAYRSEVRVERVKGPLRRAYLPAEKEPVLFSTHGAVAAHYKAQPGTYEPHATTLDYVVAATAG